MAKEDKKTDLIHLAHLRSGLPLFDCGYAMTLLDGLTKDISKVTCPGCKRLLTEAVKQ